MTTAMSASNPRIGARDDSADTFGLRRPGATERVQRIYPDPRRRRGAATETSDPRGVPEPLDRSSGLAGNFPPTTPYAVTAPLNRTAFLPKPTSESTRTRKKT